MEDDQQAQIAHRCSFCNKSQHDVRKLVAGPNVNICDECVDICVDILAEDRKDTPPPVKKPSTPLGTMAYIERSASHLAVQCSLCHMHTPVEHTLSVHSRGVLCVGCVGAIEAAIASAGHHSEA